jgi:hypothetical protein
MQYALLIYTAESTEEVSPDVWAETMAEYNAFTAHVRDAGVMRAGEALHPSATATTVRIRDGQTVTTDGPFAETKEVLGGFYIVDAADLDDAIRYAAMIPGARWGSIEVRPIIEFGAGDGSGADNAAKAAAAG